MTVRPSYDRFKCLDFQISKTTQQRQTGARHYRHAIADQNCDRILRFGCSVRAPRYVIIAAASATNKAILSTTG